MTVTSGVCRQRTYFQIFFQYFRRLFSSSWARRAGGTRMICTAARRMETLAWHAFAFDEQVGSWRGPVRPVVAAE